CLPLHLFFFTHPPPTHISTLSLHDALPILPPSTPPGTPPTTPPSTPPTTPPASFNSARTCTPASAAMTAASISCSCASHSRPSLSKGLKTLRKLEAGMIKMAPCPYR